MELLSAETTLLCTFDRPNRPFDRPNRRRRSLPGGPCLPEDQVWNVLIQVSEGLNHLHTIRVLHRDIKASNIFLSPAGAVVIGDLGLGRALGGATAFAHTRGIGTPLYFSPEVCAEAPVNSKSDIWAFGCLLYELLAGEPPFTASNQARSTTRRHAQLRRDSEAHTPPPTRPSCQ